MSLRIGAPAAGVRSYLAVRGGVDVPPSLGSRSTDMLSALGPAPLQAGDVVTVGEHPALAVPLLDFVPSPAPPDGVVEVRAHRGPRADWFLPSAIDAFYGREWEVSAESNRVGARLDPVRVPSHRVGAELRRSPVLERAVLSELPSEAMITGAVQVSPDGRPTVLLADHPVTGGYPVIARRGRRLARRRSRSCAPASASPSVTPVTPSRRAPTPSLSSPGRIRIPRPGR